MRAPSEVHINQWVQIPHGQGRAAHSELNSTFREATNWMKLEGWMYQATTRTSVNVLSHEKFIIAGVDTVHNGGRLHRCTAKAKGTATCRGLRQLHGTRWKIGELGRSIGFSKKKSTLKQVREDKD